MKLKRITAYLLSLCALALPFAALAEDEAKPLLGRFETYDIYENEVNYEFFADYDVTLVNVWGTYCGPCIEEMPYLGELAREYADAGFGILGIVIDVYDRDTLELAINIAEDTGADYTHVIPDAEIVKFLYGVASIPTSYFVDSNGCVISKIIIGRLSKEGYSEKIEYYLDSVNGGED